MNIIERNFFRLLRAGVYQQQEDIEPMSAWKWQQEFLLAQRQGLAPLLFDGVQLCNDQFFMRLTDEITSQWLTATTNAELRYQQACKNVAELLAILSQQQLRPILLEPWTTAILYPQPAHRHIPTIRIFFPYQTQGKKADEWAVANGSNATSACKQLLRYQWRGMNVEHRHNIQHLNNKLNNYTLQKLIEDEWLEGGTSHVFIGGQRIETLAPTMALLIALLNIIKTSLSEGLNLRQLVDLGILLRKQGQLVDFVKLQGWIERLRFTRITQHIGLILTGLLGFSPDEVPFMKPEAANADRLIGDLLKEGPHSNARFIRYCPGESLSSVAASITHSLGSVEE